MLVTDSVDCPTCNAKAGQRCRTLNTGRVTDTHRLRYDRYYEWLRRQREEEGKEGIRRG